MRRSAPVSRRQEGDLLPISASDPVRRKRQRKKRKKTEVSSFRFFLQSIFSVFFVLVSLYGAFIICDVIGHLLSRIKSSIFTWRTCDAVYFWGGGKAGSTSLAILLKHGYDGKVWDPNGIFIDAPKEICWALYNHPHKWNTLASQCDRSHPLILDACPRYRTPRHAADLVRDDPNSKFIMLIRDPIDRLVSDINDKQGIRISKSDVEVIARLFVQKYADERIISKIDLMSNASRNGGGSQPPWTDTTTAGNASDSIDMHSVNQNWILKYGGGYFNHRYRSTSAKEIAEKKRNILLQSLGRGEITDDVNGNGKRKSQNETSRESKVSHRVHAQVTKTRWDLSLYGKNLKALLSVVKPSQVLIVQTEALSKDPQQVIDDIFSFIGEKNKRVKTMHANQLKGHESYGTISSELRRKLQTVLQSDVELLESLVGRSFPWSWGRKSGEDGIEGDSDWLTTIPRPSGNRHKR